MQLSYRATRWFQPAKGETLVSSLEQAYQLIDDLNKKLGRKLSKHDRAVALNARTVLLEAAGDPQMLDSASEAYRHSKSAQTASLFAVALHHHGRLTEAMPLYEQAYRYPHEQGFEIDLGFVQSRLTLGRWLEAWPVLKAMKKRMVYAAYLPDWKGQNAEKVSIIAEGGFGDIIHGSRWFPQIAERVKDVTLYLPPYFFDHGFVALAKKQSWFPKTVSLLTAPQGVLSTGIFDLPAVFQTTKETVPDSRVWVADPEKIKKWKIGPSDRSERDKPIVGFCWAARAMETPICPDGVYRSLTTAQANRIIDSTERHVFWYSLQHNYQPKMIGDPKFKNFDSVNCASALLMQEGKVDWEDTAAIISELDAVVTIDSAVMHLAAAMGKPTWVLLSGAVDWKFGIDDKSCVFYPTTRLFRNNAFGFDNAVTDIIRAINEGELPLNGEFHNYPSVRSHVH